MILSKKTDNTFLVSITNINTSQDIILNSITTFVNSASALGNYTATICMRDEGSTDTCSIATSTGSIPGAPKKFSTPILIPKNSTITREIYVDSPFMSPTDLQIEIQDLDYTPGGLYSHEYWLCTGSLCQSKGPSLPEVFDNPSVLFFVTGSIVQLSLYHYDNTANFSATGMNLLMPTPPILSSGLVSNFFS